jgi:Tfp pilus assembly protein PilN
MMHRNSAPFSIGRLAAAITRIPLLGGSRDEFHINLSSRYRSAMAPIRAVLVTGCVFLVLGILWSLGMASLGYREARTISAELERTRQLDAQVIAEARQEGIDLSEGVLQRLPAEVDLANQLIEKRAFSWTRFLTGLEQVIPPRLVLSSVRLEQGGTMVHLLGSAVNLEDITAFTLGLQDHPTFKDPVLAQHRVGTNGLVEFDVTLRYSQAGL